MEVETACVDASHDQDAVEVEADSADSSTLVAEENGLDCVEDESFYTDAADYWSKIPPTVDGMLGGFGYVSHTDIQGSDAFLSHIFRVWSMQLSHESTD